MDNIAYEGLEEWIESKHGVIPDAILSIGPREGPIPKREIDQGVGGIEKVCMGLFNKAKQLCPVEKSLTHRGERMDITIDSGAAESVMPVSKCEDYPLKSGAWTGSEYGTADGGTIVNLGERLLIMDLKDGTTKGMQFQVGDKCTKALGAVSRIADKGNRVVFEASYGFIQGKQTGECTYFERKDDVYVLETIVRPHNDLFRR